MNQKAIGVIKQFESPESSEFRYQDIEPTRFNESAFVFVALPEATPCARELSRRS